ncbi:MAG: hypothetical protein AB8H86_32425 [Polyangiales bacterium]
MMTTTSSAFVLFVVALSCALPAVAQTDNQAEARSLYDAGVVAFEDGRFEAALARWQEAYDLTHLPALLYNIGTAHDRLGQAEEAATDYREYLAAVPNADNKNYVERRLALLEEQVEAAREAAAREDAAREAAAATEADAQAESEAEAEVGEGEQGAEENVNEAVQSSGLPVGAIVTTATGGALLIAGLATALVSNGRHSDLESSCVDGLCGADAQSDIDGLRRINLTTDVLLAVGGVVTVTGVIWWIVGGGSDDDSRAQVDVGLGSVSVRGRF